MVNTSHLYLHNTNYMEDDYKVAQIPITHTHTKNCITAHIKFKHDWDIMKSENSLLFCFVFIFTTIPENTTKNTENTEYTEARGGYVSSVAFDTQI
jgi:hypothetical protein